MKRSDIYTLALGSLQIWMFFKLLPAVQNMMYYISQRKGVYYFVLFISSVAMFTLIGNISQLILGYENKIDPDQAVIKVAKSSVAVLVLYALYISLSQIQV